MARSISQWFSRLAVAMLFCPWSAEAQTIARSFEELAGVAKAQETVIVTDVKGRRVKGALTAIEGDSLLLARDGRTEKFVRSEIVTVRLADGVGNGALIGAGAGLGTALGILAVAASGEGYLLPSAKVGAPLLLSGIGALVGALVDRMHENGRIVYAAPPRTSGFVISPLLGEGRRGVRVSLGF